MNTDPYQAMRDLMVPTNDSSSTSQTEDPYQALQDLVAPQDPWSTFKRKAVQVASKRGFPKAVLPVMLGQAALESGRGTSNFARNRNNYFGYEAYDSNPDNAKGYATPEESINDYLDLISSYRGVPEAMQTGDPTRIIQAIKANGYATDPNYVSKVMSTPEFGNNYGGN